MAKRALPYKDDFLKFGFTEIKVRSGLVRPQCVFCLQVLSNESMKENQLKRYLNTVHLILINKPLQFWKEHKNEIKRMRLDCPSNTRLTVSLQKTTKASFDVAWKIARSKKAHNIEEELIKPAAILWLERSAEMTLLKNWN
ncbi:protein FAM200B-like [Melanaphis sacchari]|uniref:protein FAM200B-like n=1 Tax=Melanaphis sacchari TaxID=742174 RepID=UPI000DC1501D|nr:protein FAM200B-like [Melanaphis sacchari]